MADITLFVAYIYFALVVGAVGYRAYGAASRMLTQLIVGRSLRRLESNLPLKRDGTDIEVLAKEIFKDRLVSEEEMTLFNEFSIACYIEDKYLTIKTLKNANQKKVFEIRVLTYLFGASMRDQSYRKYIIHDLGTKSNTGLYYWLISPIVTSRLQAYTMEFLDDISDEYSKAPRKLSEVLPPTLIKKFNFDEIKPK
ncbi:MAG: hypothetical protein AAGE89_03035 [Pseudomonadota bacterium]